MAGEEQDSELRDLVAQTLESQGVLGKIRAELRASVFLALEGHEQKDKPHPLVNDRLNSFLKTKDGQFTAGLVREFLQFFQLDFTCSVFDPETDVLKSYNGRENLAGDLQLNSTSDTPLLLQLLRRARSNPNSIREMPGHSTDHIVTTTATIVPSSNAPPVATTSSNTFISSNTTTAKTLSSISHPSSTVSKSITTISPITTTSSIPPFTRTTTSVTHPFSTTTSYIALSSPTSSTVTSFTHKQPISSIITSTQSQSVVSTTTVSPHMSSAVITSGLSLYSTSTSTTTTSLTSNQDYKFLKSTLTDFSGETGVGLHGLSTSEAGNMDIDKLLHSGLGVTSTQKGKRQHIDSHVVTTKTSSFNGENDDQDSDEDLSAYAKYDTTDHSLSQTSTSAVGDFDYTEHIQ